MLKTIIEHRVPASFFQIFASVGFWNERGTEFFEANKNGTMGSKFTQTKAREEGKEAFILNSLLCDVQTILKEQPEFKCGKSGSHIWVSNEKNERLILIHF